MRSVTAKRPRRLVHRLPLLGPVIRLGAPPRKWPAGVLERAGDMVMQQQTAFRLWLIRFVFGEQIWPIYECGACGEDFEATETVIFRVMPRSASDRRLGGLEFVHEQCGES